MNTRDQINMAGDPAGAPAYQPSVEELERLATKLFSAPPGGEHVSGISREIPAGAYPGVPAQVSSLDPSEIPSGLTSAATASALKSEVPTGIPFGISYGIPHSA